MTTSALGLLRRLPVAVAATAACVVPLAISATPASAQTPTLTPTLKLSATTLPPSGTSTVTVTGNSYLVPPHAPGKDVFGGVYVFFGWVDPGGNWGPSFRNGIDSKGQFGLTYTYPGEGGSGDTREDSETTRFVSFTSGGTSGTATPWHMDASGNWSVQLTIHGSVWQWSNPVSGQSATVDCQQVRCGVYTIGAHGKASRTNEVFTPITFTNGTPVVVAPPVSTPPVTAAPKPGATPPPPAANGGSTPKPRTTAPGSTSADTTSPVSVAGTEITAPGETTTTGVAESTTTSTESAITSTSSDGAGSGDTETASIGIDDDDGGSNGWAWGLGVGVPAVLGASVIGWRRFRTSCARGS